jgi:hypothetical protein
MAAHRCRPCGRFFRPDVRKRGKSKQKTCGRTACRRANDRCRRRDWIGRHLGYEASRGLKQRSWAQAYPSYWRRRRLRDAAYRERERERMRLKRRRARRAAKQTVMREILVEKLLAVKQKGRKTVAKQTVMARRVDALVDVLVWKERVAQQRVMARAGPAGGQWPA